MTHLHWNGSRIIIPYIASFPVYCACEKMTWTSLVHPSKLGPLITGSVINFTPVDPGSVHRAAMLVLSCTRSASHINTIVPACFKSIMTALVATDCCNGIAFGQEHAYCQQQMVHRQDKHRAQESWHQSSRPTTSSFSFSSSPFFFFRVFLLLLFLIALIKFNG